MPKKAKKRWVAEVRETSHAMDLPEGLFACSPQEIAQGLQNGVLASNHTIGTAILKLLRI